MAGDDMTENEMFEEIEYWYWDTAPEHLRGSQTYFLEWLANRGLLVREETIQTILTAAGRVHVS